MCFTLISDIEHVVIRGGILRGGSYLAITPFRELSTLTSVKFEGWAHVGFNTVETLEYGGIFIIFQ